MSLSVIGNEEYFFVVSECPDRELFTNVQQMAEATDADGLQGVHL